MNFGTREAEQLIEAVRQVAAEEILPRFRRLDDGEIEAKTRADDLVTVADKMSEKRLTEAVGLILPGAAVVGEEAVSADARVLEGIGSAEYSVIIDPVDGTWNFANGLGLFGVIVAVAHRGETVWGMIYDPLGDDWLMAERGAGARHVWPDGREVKARLSTKGPAAGELDGYIGLHLFPKEDRLRLLGRIGEFARIGGYRCSAHEYRLMTRGEGDFTLTPMVNAWDHAAGCLAIEELGGVARFLDGARYAPTRNRGPLIVAAGEEAWAETARVVANLW